MGKNPLEWIRQADYDMKTAEIMFDNKRYIYAVFMCHLSIEKALKGLYVQKFNEMPPKTHSLIFLVEKVELQLPEVLYDFIFTLNGVSVPIRYPDELRGMQKGYSKARTKLLLEKSKETLKWLKKLMSKQ